MDIIINQNYSGLADEQYKNLTAKIDKLQRNLLLIIQNQTTIMTDLSVITAEVAENTSVTESAVALLNGLKAALDAAGTDPIALKALSDSLSSNSDALAAAVAANTPAA